MGNDPIYPRGPHRDYERLWEEGTKEETASLGLTLPAIAYTSDGFYRIGGGGRISLKVTDNVWLGTGYIYHLLSADKIFKGHHFEIFMELPKLFSWARWRLGLFAELASLSSPEKLREGGNLAGLMIGLDMPVIKLSPRTAIDINFEGGIGPGFKDLGIYSLFLIGLGLRFNL